MCREQIGDFVISCSKLLSKFWTIITTYGNSPRGHHGNLFLFPVGARGCYSGFQFHLNIMPSAIFMETVLYICEAHTYFCMASGLQLALGCVVSVKLRSQEVLVASMRVQMKPYD